MKFTEADSDETTLIEAYDANGVLVGGRRYAYGLILTPDQVVERWGPSRPADLADVHLDALIAFEPQIIVLGTGEVQVFPDPALHFKVMEKGIGLEVMDTGAACRTYNILLTEGRRVVVGLMSC